MNNLVFNHSIKHWLTSWKFYLMIMSLFMIGLLMTLGNAGYIDGTDYSTKKNVKLLNSPFELSYVFFYYTKLVVLFIPWIISGTLERDFTSKIYLFNYTYPFNKKKYYSAKLLATYFIVGLVFFSLVLGTISAELWLGNDHPKFGNFGMTSYLFTLAYFALPTLLFISTLAFILTAITRKATSAILLLVLLFIGQAILEYAIFQWPTLLGTCDPFGQNGFLLATKNWGLAVQNSADLPISKPLMINRILICLIAGLTWILFLVKHELSYENGFQFLSKLNRRKIASRTTRNREWHSSNENLILKKLQFLQPTLYLTLFKLKFALRNKAFPIFVLLSISLVFFISQKVASTGEMNLLPMTKLLISGPLVFFTLIVIIITFYFTGLITTRAQKSKLHNIEDVTMHSKLASMASSIFAITLLQWVMLLIFLLTCIGIQINYDYFNFQIGTLVFHFMIIVIPVLLLWNIYAHFVYQIFPNIFLGMLILVGTWIGFNNIELLGIDSQALQFNTPPSLKYSDISGYAPLLSAHVYYTTLWIIFSLIVLIAIKLFWRRGFTESITHHIFQGFKSLNYRSATLGLIAISAFLLFGFQILKLESEDRQSLVYYHNDTLFKDFKKEFSQYTNLAIPKIEKIDLNLDLSLKNKSFVATGKYKITNKDSSAIDSILIRTGFDEITSLKWDKNIEILKEDTVMNYLLIKLNEALKPSESTYLHFTTHSKPNTVINKHSSVEKNGTYLKHDILPRMGYQFTPEEYALDSATVNNKNYFSEDANLLSLATTICTENNQLAIAPGTLTKNFQKEGRNCFEYKTAAPIKFNFSFHSGTYQKATTNAGPIVAEVLYHENHYHNIKDMTDGIEASLAFNQTLFGAYPFEKIRVIEFPHTVDSYSATLMANNIPTSEILFGINAKEMKEKANLPFYVMAHEVTHEWIGNQCMPAKTLGSRMLSESLTEYISFLILEESKGYDQALNFMQLQHKRYLRGKAKESKNENPLYKVKPSQQYISYGKGASTFYTLDNHIGRNETLDLIKEYFHTFKSSEDNFPTTLDFLNILHENQVDSTLINDLFKKITSYSFGLNEVKHENGNYLLKGFARKQNESNTSANFSWERIGLKITDSENNLVTEMTISPNQLENGVVLPNHLDSGKIILDPNHIFIEEDRSDNLLSF